MIKYLICFFLFGTVISAKSIHPHINVQEYGKRFHPPLVRNIRSLEDELRDLPLENEDTLGTSIEDTNSRQNENHSKDLESVVTASTIKPENILNEISSPAATEYMVTSTATPQLTNDHSWSVVTEIPSEDKKDKAVDDDEEEDEEEDDKDDDEDEEDDDDDDEEEEDDDDHEDETTTLKTQEENNNSWHFVESATEVPAYVKEAYFSAKEQRPEENLKNVSSDEQKDLVFEDKSNDDEEETEGGDSPYLASKSRNWTMDEILAKLAEIDFDDVKTISKKALKGNINRNKGKGGDEMTNEDVMEIIIKVAEDPKDWEQIRQLLEKIEYEGATLKKAKSRLRALARQKQIKLKQGGGKWQWSKVPSAENNVLPKGHENLSNHLEGPSSGYPYDLTVKTSVSNPLTVSNGQPSKTGVGSYIKVAVYPTAPVKINVKHSKHHHHQHHRHHKVAEDADYAIEQPVTVIGERSRIDPVEKQLLEASTNQRIRELQKEKARLESISNPTDDMEEQLKAVSKMERRLKEHWRQKQKLMQKIREKNYKESEREDW